MIIPELSKTKANLLANFKSPKQRRKHGVFAAEGRKCVEDTCNDFELQYLVIDKQLLSHDNLSDGLNSLIDNAYEAGKAFVATSSDMDKLTSLSTAPEVIAYYLRPQETPCPSIDSETIYLLLDGIRDPGNMGTIIRTAHWFGINTIFASQDCVDIYNSKCIQSTMGSLAKVDVVYTDLKMLISSHQEMPVCGLLLEGNNIYHTPLPHGAFIIMGNEGKGISQDLRKCVSNPLTIPPYNPEYHSESLNVAIATGITLALFRKDK